MNKKRIILLVLLLIFLVGVASASAVSDDNVKSADTSSKLAQNTHTTPNTVENNHLQENLKKVEKSNKNVKTAGNVYVSSNGKGDGKTVTTPTNITNALSMVNNNDVINLVTSSSGDKYTKNVEINENTVKSGTDTFSIVGQTGKNIVINSTLNITKMKVNLKNINFTGNIGNASIEGYNSSISIDNCTFTHDKNVTLTFNDVSTISDYREMFYAINRYVNGLKGAVHNIGGNLVVTNSVFKDNYISVPEIKASVSISQINNALEFYGGAIYNTGDNLKITNTLFENNNVIESPLFYPSDYWWERNEIHGGAIYNTGNSMRITNSTFKDNSASDYGGAIYTDGKNSIISNNIFKGNEAQYGGAIYNEGNDTVISDSSFTRNKAYSSCAIDNNKGSNVKILNSNFTSNEAKYTAAIGSYHCEDTIISHNIFKHNKANDSGAKTVIEVEDATANIANNIGDKTSIYNQTIRFYESSGTVTYNNFTDKSQTKIKVSPVKGIIGETITLKAILTDDMGDEISGGNLAFKLNGKTLRSDGRFDSNAPAMKFSVKNGLVTHTIKADLYLRNAKNLTASYSGTSIYNESTSESVTAQIQKRNAQLTVTTTPSKAKQYETLTFTIKAKDITKNGKNTTMISDNTKVMLKVNGVTLKDNSGKTLYVTLDKNAQATYKYTIPAGTGGITANKAARNYKVDAIFVGDNYYPGARNTTSFQVERSPTTVTITQVKATSSNVLSVKATLKDYKGNNLIGTNKVTIKINGKSYTRNGKAVYWSVKNGNVDLTGIQVDPKTTIKRVLLVTGERQAYLEGRAETTTILRG